MVYALRFGTLPSLALLAGSVFWGGLHIALLTSLVTRGWYGRQRARRAAGRVVSRAPAEKRPADDAALAPARG